jgi:pyruvate dehydrogenase E2 component (dihydrolipoamide acetyltransferase)
VLCDVITDKANFELTAEAAGTLRKIIAHEKSQVPLDYVLAIIGEPEEDIPDVSVKNAALMEAYRASVIGKTVSAPKAEPPAAADAQPTERVRATPRARRMAREAGVDLAEVQRAAGVDRVTEKDVEDFLKECSS